MENNINSTKDVPSKKSKLRKHAEDAWDLVKFAALALAIVVPIRMFIAQPFVVSGESMFSTFHDGQYLIVDEISYLLSHPHRGDVVIFKYPLDTSRYFIKRVIGMPNEKISINKGVITIINKENPNGFVLDEPYIREKFDTTGEYTTGDGEYFALGDNRNFSLDSRSWGVVPKKDLVGRAYLRLLPFNSISYLPGAFKETK